WMPFLASASARSAAPFCGSVPKTRCSTKLMSKRRWTGARPRVRQRISPRPTLFVTSWRARVSKSWMVILWVGNGSFDAPAGRVRRVIAVLPASLRPLLEGRLPDWLEPRWWTSPEHLLELAPQAEIGWFDQHRKAPVLAALERADKLRWLNSSYAGVDWMPLRSFAERGIVVTCGSGLTAGQVAEFAVLTMLAVAKDYRAVVRAQDRHEWLPVPPGTRDLDGSRALLIGHGAIGQAIDRALAGFGVEVTAVTSRNNQDWRSRLGEFD